MKKKIGGFFGLELDAAMQTQSLLSLWDIPQKSHWSFSNGRSALYALLQHVKPKTCWLPAYSCTSLAEGAAHTNLRFFPLNKNLSPDCDYLKTHIAAGDAVQAIDYFGRNPDAEFIAFCKSRADIHWIEDRSQALLPSKTAWGDYVLYSPRKLLGVPDGGIIVGITKKLPDMQYSEGATEADFIRPSLLRYEDKTEAHNAVWYRANVALEASLAVSQTPMSRISHYILNHVDVQSIITKRKANYAALMQALVSVALLPDDGADFVPFGFPIRVKDRQKIAATLHQNNIFAAHHWPELPSSQSDFPNEHFLSQQLITLPCDHRYDEVDMQRIAAILKTVMA